MPGPNSSPLPQGNIGLTRVQSKDQQISERACRKIISRHRQRIDWMLQIPEWETLYGDGLVELNMPQPRRGINLRSVVDSLLLENKFALMIWVLDHAHFKFSSKIASTLCNNFGLDLWDSRDLDNQLNRAQWDEFQAGIRFSLTQEHRSYKRAQTILFRRYQSLLHKMVNRQVFDSNKRPDAYQEASLGLIHAIDKVEDSPTSFGSYARTWISRQIKNFLMGEHFPVHVPINLASKILRSQSQDESQPKTENSNLSNLVKPGVSLDQMADDSEDGNSKQVPDDSADSPSESLSEQDIYKAVHSLMSELTDKQREVLQLRYGLDSENGTATLASIAEKVGISHQQVSMREKRALQKLETILKPLYEEIYG
ncbi:sigma-70 family RNA polymerase sigma factor [Rubellicoccus peritrichatus]|uniref:Sigma-70 family RNA polymerase sigma factor n=1 Tax=Rubellicoccus peritrichatus TaxID=3080537 RepID=A0AAQ3QV92_9BACT|nr:sigma-70 family RNA polymerase sigma factor [Puniceicoccus sp. CR14]WOO41313.1 sigma-70 family RNA polymerase sigma factor [Puniceicoccus sp. CR14]